MIMQAKKKNADGIVAMRFTASPVTQGAAPAVLWHSGQMRLKKA